MKVKAKDLQDKDRILTLDALYTAASSVKGREATKGFLKDLLTESERIMLGRRILIARNILLGKSQRDIMLEMKVGPDTVHKVAKWLEDQFPGYEKAIAGMEQEFNSRKRKKSPELGTFAYLKKRYPLHFLLFNVADELNARKQKRKKK